MKEIVVISGKGGTGKTSITASFAMLGGKNITVADCDVDAADMHLLLQPDWSSPEDFYSGVAAVIDQEKCTKCGKCMEVCAFKAVSCTDNKYSVNLLNCEGCSYCFHVCPSKAIIMEDQNVGKCYISNTKAGNMMVHAALGIGADNSGKLVAKVKKEAKRVGEENSSEFVLVDGSPGIGCPVVSSLSGADYIVLVTEPTVSGFHDLKRVYELVKSFHIKAGCIINKHTLNREISDKIENFLKEEGILHISSLPYDESFTEAMTNGLTVAELESGPLKSIIEDSWEKIKKAAK